MTICQHCKEEYSTPVIDHAQRKFPAFTLMTGLAGTVGAALTGTILLVPAALVLGAAVDTQNCDGCGECLSEDDSGYQLMEEREDGLGGSTYRLTGQGPKPSEPRQSSGSNSASRFPKNQMTEKSSEDHEVSDSDFSLDDHEENVDFTFDDSTAGLVPLENPSDNLTEFSGPMDHSGIHLETDPFSTAPGINPDITDDAYHDLRQTEDSYLMDFDYTQEPSERDFQL